MGNLRKNRKVSRSKKENIWFIFLIIAYITSVLVWGLLFREIYPSYTKPSIPPPYAFSLSFETKDTTEVRFDDRFLFIISSTTWVPSVDYNKYVLNERYEIQTMIENLTHVSYRTIQFIPHSTTVDTVCFKLEECNAIY